MNAWMHVAGWVLVHFVWQGAVVAIAAALVLHLCRRQAASVRYLIACGAMTVMLLGVVTTAALVEGAGCQVSRPTRASVRTTGDGRVERSPADSDKRRLLHPRRCRTQQRVEMLLPWIVSAWLFGVIAAARSRGRRLVARSSSASARAGIDVFELAGSRQSHRVQTWTRLESFASSSFRTSTCRWWSACLRPIVVLPIAAMTQLNAAQVEAILAHEIAHMRRHDYLVNLMQTLAETAAVLSPGGLVAVGAHSRRARALL